MKLSLLLLGCALLSAPPLCAQNTSDTIGEVFATGASVRGSVMLTGTGTQVLSGSQVTAGDGVALLRMTRGGEIRICPRTNLSLSSPPSAKTLVLGMNTGAIELFYSITSGVDALVTPDFRVQLIGPGTFHLAVSVAPSGDTCLRPLGGNNAAVFLAEMMGNDSYQLAPGKSVLFKAGKLSQTAEAPAVCGCPEEPPAARPSAEGVVPNGPKADVAEGREEAAAAKPQLPEPVAEKLVAEQHPEHPPEPIPERAPEHLELQDSFVYHGDHETPELYSLVAKLTISGDNSGLTQALLPQVSPPPSPHPEPVPAPKEGTWHRVKGFFGKMFHW